jgi:hypothetical protein
MRIRHMLAVALFLAALPMYADFNAVVREVQLHGGLHRETIPFLGLARFAVWIIHPDGIYDFQLATFDGDSRTAVDYDDLTAMIRKAAGAGYRPLVQARSKRNGEFTYILAKPVDENRIDFMLATHDRSDTVVIRAVIDADKMLAHINEPHSFARLGTK